MNTLKIEFICGTSVDRAGISLDPSTIESGKSIAGKLLLKTFGGYSKSLVEGAWRSPTSGQTAHDVSIVYTVLSNKAVMNADRLDAIQSDLAAAFHQESVPYIVTEVFCKF